MIMLRVFAAGRCIASVFKEDPDGRGGIVLELALGNRPEECHQETCGYEKTGYNQNDDDAQRMVLGKTICSGFFLG